MRKTMIVALALSAVCSTAQAMPVTLGTWIDTPQGNEALYTSEDCDWLRGSGKTCHIFDILPPNTQMLHGAFRFPDWQGELIFSITDYKDTISVQPDGELILTSDHATQFSSLDGVNVRLFKQDLPGQITYFTCGEDLDKPIVWDCNDMVWKQTYIIETPPCLTCKPPIDPPCTVNCDPPTTVPEPTSVMLFGIILISWSLYARRRKHLH